MFGFTSTISSLANRGTYQYVHSNRRLGIRIGQNISTLYLDRPIRFSLKSKNHIRVKIYTYALDTISIQGLYQCLPSFFEHLAGRAGALVVFFLVRLLVVSSCMSSIVTCSWSLTSSAKVRRTVFKAKIVSYYFHVKCSHLSPQVITWSNHG